MTQFQENQEQIMTSLTNLFNKIDAYYKPQMEAEFSNISLSEIERKLQVQVSQPSSSHMNSYS
ncbi:hypothetical protein [Lactococcus cremoris]|uniref:hypothetical protein n=1 Tax=Lactococcus lactis subsp. cremoris TaxID=1359 RepID=UPI0020B7A06F|nr:hypothetical protein [Lactococcus cremoris]